MGLLRPAEPLLQLTTIEDVHVAGVDHIQVFGDNARVIYFTWVLAEDRVTWQRVAVRYAITLPLSAVAPNFEQRHFVVRQSLRNAVAEAVLH